MTPPILEIRQAKAEDEIGILHIASSIPLFSSEEVACVKELWEDYLRDVSAKDGYAFLIASQAGRVVGFACFGHRPLTESTFDLYWIAVDPNLQHQGMGRALLQRVESAVSAWNGKLLIVETSGQDRYAPTRHFYEKHNYRLEANIRDFYKPGDDLLLFSKKLS